MKIKFLIIIIILVMAIGFSASAQTTNIKEIIAQLQAQIAKLQAQLQTLLAQQNNSGQWCHTFNKNLKIGNKDRGAEIQALWTALGKEFPGDSMNISLDHEGMGQPDTFGENTATAVVAFQKKYGIMQTGYVGPLTRAKLNKLYGCQKEKKEKQECNIDSDCPTIYCIKAPCPQNKCINAKCKTPENNGCENLWWFDSTNIVCRQKEFCGTYMYYGLQTFSAKEACQQALIKQNGFLYPKTQDDCATSGGVWAKYGLNPKKWCNVKTTDKDKVCADDSQCQGICLGENANANQGRCSPWLVTFGCYNLIVNGKASPEICVD